ncbi:DUF4342 domain-containing protein [Pseudooceanicola sp. CBS1P-1]|uniref:DUF4342 domain-containing protein n=1 Tax=Pseudooceanicola albus TaxID=2692189 RepID=A0A6L7FZK0_9RHOB|nr:MULTISPECIES: DUF4342 domain-containing protein [Pseudooceanicola]MBT9383911.1 DUF4342 domain-containing protein [Pseudooceanicola endophyticus]MXN16676.1 DUF4342 domain-containing protein [Pseudooceanicola albus]
MALDPRRTACIDAPALIDHVRDRIAEGNVNRLRIRDPDGSFTLELPVTAAVVAGGALALAAPWLTLLGAAAGLATQLHVEVEHGHDPPHAPTEADTLADGPLGDNLPI